MHQQNRSNPTATKDHLVVVVDVADAEEEEVVGMEWSKNYQLPQ